MNFPRLHKLKANNTCRSGCTTYIFKPPRRRSARWLARPPNLPPPDHLLRHGDEARSNDRGEGFRGQGEEQGAVRGVRQRVRRRALQLPHAASRPVVRLLGKQSQVGWLDELYRSVEELSTEFFRTEACKAMLLNPINAAAKQCCQLKVRADDTKHREVYVCGDVGCCAHADRAFSLVPGAVCRCGKAMQQNAGKRPENDGDTVAAADSEVGVFVKGEMKFIVTDDLQVAPASTSLMLSPFDKFGVDDPSSLEQMTLQPSSDKMISLLKRSLTSKQPLTGHYFDVAIVPDDSGMDMLCKKLHAKLHAEQGNDAEHTPNKVRIRILQTKNNSSLLYAEVGEDFVDLLFGLLSIPLGSIMKSYGKFASKGCVDNLYSSIDGSSKECMKPECQILLLSPKVASFFGCGASKILQVEELAPNKQAINACFKCFKIGGFMNLVRCREKFWNPKQQVWQFKNCVDNVKTANLSECDPKSPKGGSDKGESYVKKGAQNFMVTDDLHVLPLSLTSALRVVSDAKIQRKELVEKELTLTRPQVMELLKAALLTRKTLSSVLLPPKNKKLHHVRYGLY